MAAPWRERLRTWLPVLTFTLLLAFESTSYLGSDRTSDPLRRVVEALFGYDVCVNWEAIHHLIRKIGHFIGYGIFSFLCFRAFWITLYGVASRIPRQLRAFALSILTTFLAGALDELHQSFVPNRTGQFSDVLLDTCGGVALCFVLFLAMQTFEWIKKVRALPNREPLLPVAVH
jgi:VanZ family protein